MTNEPRAAAIRLAAELRDRVDDERVIDAIASVPRERFVPPELVPYAYEDRALGIGHGQTISQPTIVAMMTAALRLRGHERVLDVGTGSGYQAAILAQIAGEVVSVEVVEPLRERAAALLRELEITNVRVVPDEGELGAPSLGPYDGIVVAAAAPAIPQPLIDQLAPNGRIVIPVGRREEQELLVATRSDEDLTIENLGPCRFVPLVGEHGFAPREA